MCWSQAVVKWFDCINNEHYFIIKDSVFFFFCNGQFMHFSSAAEEVLLSVIYPLLSAFIKCESRILMYFYPRLQCLLLTSAFSIISLSKINYNIHTEKEILQATERNFLASEYVFSSSKLYF